MGLKLSIPLLSPHFPTSRTDPIQFQLIKATQKGLGHFLTEMTLENPKKKNKNPEIFISKMPQKVPAR